MVDIYLLVALVLFLGVYNWRLITQVNDQEEQIAMANDLILTMAEELQSLGSPNVKVVEREK